MSVPDCVRNLIESLIKGDMISIIVLSAGFPVQNLSSAFSLRFTSQARNEESLVVGIPEKKRSVMCH